MSISERDRQLALSVVGERPAKKKGRRRRCGSCGLLFTPEELQPDHDENGRQVGWICENCY